MKNFDVTSHPSSRRTPGSSDFVAATTLGPGVRRGDELKNHREIKHVGWGANPNIVTVTRMHRDVGVRTPTYKLSPGTQIWTS